MSIDASTFLMPKEQFPAWEYLTPFAASRAVEDVQDSKRVSFAQSYFFFWARNALYHGLKALGVSPGAHVLLPAYLCRAAVEPFEAFGAEVEFYNVGRQCSASLAEIEAKIRPRTEVLLTVHYFGFPQQIRQFRELCDRHKLLLMEDCAHVFGAPTSTQLLGTFGDASVFSGESFCRFMMAVNCG